MALDEKDIVAEKLKSVTPVAETPRLADNAYEANYDVAKEHSSLYEQFGIDPGKHDPRVDEHMAKIWDYAKTVSTGKDKDSIVFEIIRLKNRLGSASLGEKSWSKVLNYVTYWGQMHDADDRMRELEHGARAH